MKMNDDVKILFVDDEPNILKTLSRLMSLEDFDCSFANSGKEGLEVLEREPHDIVVSDMRMPEMNGDEFLTQVKERYPNTIRFILSGYSDFSSMMNALNKGGVQQFIAKPWDDDFLVSKLKESIDVVKVRKERDVLVKLTAQQAEELKKANQSLEMRVEARTQEVKQTADMLDLSYQELKNSYNVFIDVIAQVLQLRSIAPRDHLNDISETARSLAHFLEQSEEQKDNIFKAAKLHELGKIKIPDTILKKPLSTIKGAELTEYKNYPMQGYSLMTSLDNLSEVANLIKSHCERFDGRGFPAKLAGEDIPLGSRIISISMNYFLYRNGLMDGKSHSNEESEAFIRAAAGQLVDPNLVDPFVKVVTAQLEKKGKHESRVALEQAKAGMVLSRDLFNARGMIMLTKGAVLTEKIISKLEFISEKDATRYTLYVDNKNIEE
jgi:response regulator RpfG family c-di-GMP phosphodiesterase